MREIALGIGLIGAIVFVVVVLVMATAELWLPLIAKRRPDPMAGVHGDVPRLPREQRRGCPMDDDFGVASHSASNSEGAQRDHG
jgi:hypothetical protein